ncbi:type I pantothenate kinase [Sandaracinobacter neustonicus]|uniref:Type I pantothenate kinase n=1 Tax=Sandaracinobacter neustonicus TaxID=1715348 RepID=A0A501XHZ7_9SPHN|nr:type I pantothenate kinase [Sandaracinobacter neustonicus]TPE60166.1 type I pantothenate kinase [Sandaracinobacter neustonicus]
MSNRQNRAILHGDEDGHQAARHRRRITGSCGAMARPISVEQLAALVATRHGDGVHGPTIAGLTGSVAVGKSTLAASLAAALAPYWRVEVIQTDGFLFPNAELESRGLLMRKGFPESYDSARLAATLEAARNGPVEVPAYSHSLYDVDPALTRRIDRPDILLVEGLGFAPVSGDSRVIHALDSLLYLDATEEDLEHWFLDRFMSYWRAAETDPTSFYAQFRHLSEAEARGFGRTVVWRQINLPNLHEHISRARPLADILVAKARDHSLKLVRPELDWE